MNPDEDRPAGLDQVADGVANLRSTARWLVAAFATVGAALLAGIQLADLGAADHPWVAAVSFGVAMVAVVIAVGAASEVLRPRAVTPSQLATAAAAKPLRDAIEKDPALLEEAASDLAALVQDLSAKRAAADRAWKAERADEEGHADRVAALRADQAAYEVEDVVTRLSDYGLFLSTAHAFFVARWIIAVSALVTSCAMAVFAYTTSSPPPDEQVPRKAVLVSLHLTADGREVLRSALGARCELRGLGAVRLGGSTAEPEVVTLPAPGCRPQRFTLTPELGAATVR